MCLEWLVKTLFWFKNGCIEQVFFSASFTGLSLPILICMITLIRFESAAHALGLWEQIGHFTPEDFRVALCGMAGMLAHLFLFV